MLCSATYVFDEVRGKFGSVGKVDTALYRGALVLAPGQTSNDNFPPGYVAAADGTYGSYLLAHPDCDRADATGGEYADRFGGATVLCRRTLRVVKIYAFDGWNGPGQLQVRLTFPGGQSDFPIDRVNINNRHRAPPWLEGARNGFAFPVLVGDGVEYEIFGDVPDDWIIDFSDPIFGNRWPADELELAVGGRDCPAKIRSTHDRRFVFASPSTSLLDRARGRGACTAHPPMPAVDCAAVSLGLDECPELCGNCPGDSYCRCGVGQCVCPPGRSGPNCAPDLACDRGQPVARFLGPGSVVAEHACVCDEGWTGDACDFNACAGVDCSGRGECRATEDGDWTCECEPDYLGRNCQHTCKDHCGNHNCGLWVPTGYCEPGGTCWSALPASDRQGRVAVVVTAAAASRGRVATFAAVASPPSPRDRPSSLGRVAAFAAESSETPPPPERLARAGTSTRTRRSTRTGWRPLARRRPRARTGASTSATWRTTGHSRRASRRRRRGARRRGLPSRGRRRSRRCPSLRANPQPRSRPRRGAASARARPTSG